MRGLMVSMRKSVTFAGALFFFFLKVMRRAPLVNSGNRSGTYIYIIYIYIRVFGGSLQTLINKGLKWH